MVQVDVAIYTDDGELVAEVGGFRLLAASEEMLAATDEKQERRLYVSTWQLATKSDSPSVSEPLDTSEPHSWLIVGDGCPPDLVAALQRSGQVSVVGSKQNANGELDHYRKLIASFGTEGGPPPLSGIVHWAAEPASIQDDDGSSQEGDESLRTLLCLAQAAVQVGDRVPRLCTVTRGAQHVGGVSDPRAVRRATLWGFMRSLEMEHHDLRPVCVDLGSGRSVRRRNDHSDGRSSRAVPGAGARSS